MEARHNMTNRLVVFVAFALVVLACPLSADARQEVVASGIVAATSIESRTEMSGAAAIGFRVNRLAGIGMEVAMDGRATIFTTNVRIDIPMITPRVIPYVIAGGGVANLKERFAITPSPAVSPALPVVIPPQLVTQSSTDLALTAGGGVSLLVAAHLSLDLDVRYARLIGDHDRNVGRFGVGFSYRF
jgi:hypothetical protein